MCGASTIIKDYMLSSFTLTVYKTWMTGTIPLCTSTDLLYSKGSMLCNSSWLYLGQISPPGLQSINVCHVYFHWICNKQFLNLESYNRAHIKNAYIYIYISTQSFWTGTKVIRRKHINQPTDFGACSSTCCLWDGEDVPAPWEWSNSHPLFESKTRMSINSYSITYADSIESCRHISFTAFRLFVCIASLYLSYLRELFSKKIYKRAKHSTACVKVHQPCNKSQCMSKTENISYPWPAVYEILRYCKIGL